MGGGGGKHEIKRRWEKKFSEKWKEVLFWKLLGYPVFMVIIPSIPNQIDGLVKIYNLLGRPYFDIQKVPSFMPDISSYGSKNPV